MDDDGCKACVTCVDHSVPPSPVAVPYCWEHPAACPAAPICGSGESSIVVRPRGEKGARPCCDQYACAGIVDNKHKVVPKCPPKEPGINCPPLPE